jgi:hypothetical protein
MSELPVIRPLPDAAPQARPDQEIRGEGWRVTVLTDGLFRVEWSGDGVFEDRASTLAIRRDLPAVPFTAERVGGGVVVTTARARLRYDGRPPSPHGLVVELVGADPGRWRYGDDAPDLGGTARTLDDVDGRTELGPGVLARGGIAVLDDSPSFLFTGDGWLGTRVPGRRDLYVFAYGRDYADAVNALYQLSGAPTRLPRWALGNWWSRYHLYSADSHLALVDRFRDEGLPFSVAVLDMDWHRVGSVPARYGSGWTGYSWERSLFPDPAAFLAELHRRGLRTTLNLHPADGVRAFEDAYPEMARAVGVDPESEEAVPFDPTDPAFLRAYFSVLHHPLEAEGVDFWWIDWQQGRVSGIDGVDPLWLLNHFHHLDAARRGGPGMTFSRYAGPGSHRYAVGFSGDTVVSWASLDFQPEFTATAANIGYCWWSHDIGGHIHGVRDDELQVRWTQLGVFSPILRLHSTDNPFIRKEPWLFPAEHRAALGEALRLRHRLVPYLHTMNHRAAAGTPLVRPLYHLEPRRPEAFTVPNEYAFGSELLVAPITSPRGAASLHGSARAWLPPGLWTDIVTGTAYRGDRHLTLHRPLASIPVLLRAGGILPLTSPTDLDATRNPAALEVLVAPSTSGSLDLVEDPEDDSETGSATTPLRWDGERGEFVIGAVTGRADAVPAEREWTITFLALPPRVEATVDGEVTVDGEPIPVTVGDGRWSVTVRAASAVGAVIRVGGPVRVGPDRRAAIRDLLQRAQAGNGERLAAWEVVASDRTAAERIAELGAIDLPDDVRAAVTELLAAAVDVPADPTAASG